jgi:hypothetical protein
MDQEIVKSLNLMKIDVVIIKGKIAGIKKSVEIIMDSTTFQEWKEKLEAKESPNKNLSFAEAFKQEFNKFILIFRRKS